MNRFRQTRRQWLLCAPGASAMAALAWDNAGASRPLSRMTPRDARVVTGNHVGFRPDARKRIIVRSSNLTPATRLSLSGGGSFPRSFPVGVTGASGIDSGALPVFLNDLHAEGPYAAGIGTGEPFHFTVARDAWFRVLPVLAGYAHHQRCGHSDRTSYPVCHLDDGKRRDDGSRVDTTGGWHDAGDLRKWVDATLMNLFGLTALARNLKTNPDAGPLSVTVLLDEARYGNAFFLKMQDRDGLVWADVGGGVHGDNSDNHWTDNVPGTSDDRWINVEKRPAIQSMFVMAQAMMYQHFSKRDPQYAAMCLNAALRCWRASTVPGGNTTDLAWRTLAAVELSSATAQPEFQQQVLGLANRLANLQVKTPPGHGQMVRGFFPMWPGNQQPLRDSVHSALPAFALLQAARSVSASSPADARNWSNGVRLYLDEYVEPMTAFSSYGILPFGLFLDAPAGERYRPLSDRYTFRFFMPSGIKFFTGLNSHLLSHALLFADAERHFGESKYRDMAYAHLEWVFGTNPFGASLVTGVGSNQPPAFSPFVGLIPGGIMNGICGNEEDQPVLNQESSMDWHTNEYWSPHSGYCLWALSLLEAPR